MYNKGFTASSKATGLCGRNVHGLGLAGDRPLEPRACSADDLYVRSIPETNMKKIKALQTDFTNCVFYREYSDFFKHIFSNNDGIFDSIFIYSIEKTSAGV